MGNVLNEAYKISRSNDLKSQPFAFVDPNAPENANTFKYKDVLKDYGAHWSLLPMYKYNFPPHTQGFWFWFIGKTEESWKQAFENYIKPALREVHRLEGASDEESQQSIVNSLDELILKIKSTPPTFSTELVITDVMKNTIDNKLEEFKKRLVNIGDDATFKETIKKVMSYRKAKGYAYSLFNNFLIMIQNPDATIVNSKTDWIKFYNRTINKDAKPILLNKPTEKMKVSFNNTEKATITTDFLKKAGANSPKDLGAGEKQRLDKALSAGKLIARRYEFYTVYDVSDTTLIEGKEDPIQDVINREKVDWHPDDMQNEEVRPIYDALLDIAKSYGIEVELADPKKMGGAKGSSGGGKIYILQNEGNDVGMTKTLVHEIAHELLHQSYAKGRNKELEKYFIGQEQGRGIVEQQAELTAWMVMASFGFDLQTTSINYAVLWGGDDKNMVDVFENVSSVANNLIFEITKRGAKLTETEVDVPTGIKKYTPMDVAKILGVEQKFQQVLKTEEPKIQMMERYRKLINK